MRKQKARTSELDLDCYRRGGRMKLGGKTVGGTQENESRDDSRGAALWRCQSNQGDANANRTQTTKESRCNQSALTTTLNLDDGALSAENAMEEMDRNREVADACEHEGAAIKEDLALRKTDGRGVDCNI